MATRTPTQRLDLPEARFRYGTKVIALAGGLAAAAVVVFGEHGHLHWPDPARILSASPQIQIHLAAAVSAFGLGTVQILSPKGALLHRLVGWGVGGSDVGRGGSVDFIRVIFPGHFSYIHLLMAWVLVAAPLGVFAARRGDIAAHRRFMTGLYYFGLIVAGAFTFAPGRILFRVFFQ